jgi:iron complex transport system substrate-binding protein
VTAAADAAPRTVPAGMGSGAPDGEFPRTVGHFGGSTIIPVAPERVVVISTGQLDAVLTLGVVPAGSTSGAGAALVPTYLTEAYPEQREKLAAMADLGLRLEPNLEAIAVSRPDLILVNAAGAEGIYPQLSQIAPTVQTEGTGVNWKQDFLLVADGLGRTEQAQRFLDDYHRTAGLRAIQGAGEPTVSFLRVTADRTRIIGAASFVGSIAQDAGFGRPATQSFDATSQDIAQEELQYADADWIFYGIQPGAGTGAPEQNPLWSGLTAVAAGRVRSVDDDMWFLNAGPTAATGVLTELVRTSG